MFSGIVRDIGIITGKTKIQEGYRFKVKSRKIAKDLKVADSVAVNGVCHTVTRKKGNEFEFVSMHETLKKTSLGSINVRSEVNLESSLRMNDEIGGHFVFGHIDDTGIITEVKQIKADKNSPKESDNWEYRIRIDKKHSPFVIYVGSIAIDGVSLTVAEVKPVKGKFFEIKVAIIPYTYNNTLFKNYRKGSTVNIEFDFLGKYVQRVLSQKPAQKS